MSTMVAHRIFSWGDLSFVESTVEGTLPATQQPRSVILMLDVSGSMVNSIEIVRRAAQLLAESLPRNARLWMFTFSDIVSLWCANVPYSDSVAQMISRITTDGATNTHAALAAVSAAARSAPAGSQVEIHLLTDGMPTVGPGTQRYDLSDEDAVFAGLDLTGVPQPFFAIYALGWEINLPFLQKLAGRVDGMVHPVPTLDDLGRALGAVMSGLQTTVAHEVVIDWPDRELLFGTRRNLFVSSGQAILTLWRGESSALVHAKTPCAGELYTYEPDSSACMAEWRNYLAFQARVNQLASLKDKPEALRIWAFAVQRDFETLPMPECMRASVAQRIRQAQQLFTSQHPNRFDVENLEFAPLILTRAASQLQRQSSDAFTAAMRPALVRGRSGRI